MCGLFGFVGRLQREKRVALLRTLCMMNTSRGHHSVGLARIDRGRKPFIYRDTVAPETAIRSKAFVSVADDIGQVWIGHTRWATRGDITIENAHPFHIGNVVLAHNGMVHVDQQLRERCDNVDYPVDSQYLAHLINKDGVIGEIGGTCALAFSELKSAVDVSLLRHSNPLCLARIGKRAGLVWASEEDALITGLAIANIRDYELVKKSDFTDGTRIDVYLDADNRISDVKERDNGVKRRYQSVGFHQQSYNYDSDYSVPYNGYGQLSGAPVVQTPVVQTKGGTVPQQYYYRTSKNGSKKTYIPLPALSEKRSSAGHHAACVCTSCDGRAIAIPDVQTEEVRYGDALQRMQREDDERMAQEFAERLATEDANDDTVLADSRPDTDDPTLFGLPPDTDTANIRRTADFRG